LIAVGIIARELNQDIDTVLKWRLPKIFTFENVGLSLSGKKLKLK